MVSVKRFILTILIFQSILVALSQGQANIWYFGQNAGLDFNNGEPMALIDGSLDTTEGCSTISDEDGRLLFYTDGVTVWNRIHQPMPNGEGLLGNFSSTQSALIIPQPGSEHIFYIFTAGAQVNADFRFSIVDLLLDGGQGDISIKNQLLLTPSTEKITAIHHSNKEDIWVIAHQWNTNSFYAYLMTETGLSSTPVISSTGTIHQFGASDSNVIGQMKASPNGKNIGLVIAFLGVIEILAFNSSNGQVSSPTTITFDLEEGFGLYGFEFSPNSKLIYISEAASNAFPSQRIFQYDLSSNDEMINPSGIPIGSVTQAGGIQLAPDGKIYITQVGEPFLARIDNPNGIGAASDFQENAIDLSSMNSYFGLPGFIQSYFQPPDPILVMPNIFTPNDDQSNPRFQPKTFSNIQNATLSVVNRWGKDVFETNDILSGWDGKVNNELATTGIYYWQISFEGTNGTIGSQKGWVHLLR